MLVWNNITRVEELLKALFPSEGKGQDDDDVDEVEDLLDNDFDIIYPWFNFLSNFNLSPFLPFILD